MSDGSYNVFAEAMKLQEQCIAIRADNARLTAENTRLTVALNDALAIGEGINDGPWKHCHDCGRRMVWQYDASDGGSPSWMCPNCVMRRLQRRDEQIRQLRKNLASVWRDLKVATMFCGKES